MSEKFTDAEIQNLIKVLDLSAECAKMSDKEVYLFVEHEIWGKLIHWSSKEDFILSELLTRFAKLNFW